MSLAKITDQHRQNKVSRLAREMSAFMPYDLAMAMLLRHGVFKWFACRRDLIALKNRWRDEIRSLQHQGDRQRLRAYEEARREVRRICHSSRLRAPDHDTEAQRWLRAALTEET